MRQALSILFFRESVKETDASFEDRHLER
jgi:hypothetical protein